MFERPDEGHRHRNLELWIAIGLVAFFELLQWLKFEFILYDLLSRGGQ